MNTVVQATSASTLILLASSPYEYVFTGTVAGQIFKLPVATTLKAAGFRYEIWNISTQTITVNNNGGTTLYVVQPNQRTWAFLQDNSTSNGLWLFDSTPIGNSSSAVQLTVVEINVSNMDTAQYSGNFQISGSGLIPGKPVLIQQASGPYTGKGYLADEAEMDQVNVTASVLNSTTIQAYWTCQPKSGPVSGYIAFQYAVSL
jgi:hypothetical protein